MRLAPLALALLVAFSVPAEAASRNTARASNTIPLRDGPGSSYAIIGQLAGGTRVRLDQCTCESNWCLVLLDGELVGWARGSYLVGSAAKMEVTPVKPLFNPHRRDHFRHSIDDDFFDDNDEFVDTIVCR